MLLRMNLQKILKTMAPHFVLLFSAAIKQLYQLARATQSIIHYICQMVRFVTMSDELTTML